MDPKSRFLSALAAASLSVALANPSSAQAFPKTDLYGLCKQGNELACSLFLRNFPNSTEAPYVVCCAVDAIVRKIADLDPETYHTPSPYDPPSLYGPSPPPDDYWPNTIYY